MPPKSSMKTLNPTIQAAVIKALENGATIDDIVVQLDKAGHKRSRSAVGRYAKDYQEIAARQRDMRSVAEAFAADFGGTDNAEGKLLVQVLTSVGARMVLPLAGEDEPEMDAKTFQMLAKGVKDLLGAAKVDAERDAKLRDEAAKAARAKAADDAESAARSAGATQDTINRVKASILGLPT